LVALCVSAVALSAGYLHLYLRGGPRIIDATAYLLEARALAAGGMSFPVPAPTQAFRGRFLVVSPSLPSDVGSPGELLLGVLFPPGYPALLSLGVLVGKPLWVGPLLGGALVVATYALAHRLSARRDVALLAAALSALSAALRYHSADTMSHGWAALLFTTALWAALGAAPGAALGAAPGERPGAAPRALAVAGLCTGLLLATRPVTGLVCFAGCVALAALSSLRGRLQLRVLARHFLAFALPLAPGLALLGWHQLELTGTPFGSAQLRYYGVADGPPGCFGLGFHAGLGCRYEHGDVVARFGASGFGPWRAFENTLHRLHHHALDVANFEPLALLVPWAVKVRWHAPAVRVLAACALGILLAYAAFYFPGNFPGGGARFFAELLPAEHAVLAWGVTGGAGGAGRVARWIVPLSLVGFGIHASHSHRHLAEREGGRPMFEPEVVERALGPNPPGSLVFVDTDHGFNLGYDPALHLAGPPGQTRIPAGRTLVARTTSHTLDQLLWERLGRPPAFRYRHPWSPTAAPELERETFGAPEGGPHAPESFLAEASAVTDSPLGAPRDLGTPWVPALRLEAEHDWPPLTVEDGWVEPTFPPVACVSNGRVLALHPLGTQSAVGGALDVPAPGLYRLAVGLVAPRNRAESTRPVHLRVGETTLSFSLPTFETPCPRVDLGSLPLPAHTVRWVLESNGQSVQLDYLEIVALDPRTSGP
jgi:hypothetical protein